MQFVKSLAHYFSLIAVAIFLSPRARAEPSFARKYHADCTLCHTVYPHLNRTGYLFRLLGYRLPADVQRRLAPSSAATATNPASLNHETTRAGQELVQSFTAFPVIDWRAREARPARRSMVSVPGDPTNT